MFLNRMVALATLGSLVLCCSRSRDNQPDAATPQIGEGSAVPTSDAGAVQRLRDPRQAVRDAAAAEIRKAIANNPSAANDPGEAYWKEKLTPIARGITQAAFQAATGATTEGGISSGQSSTTMWRLDDYWTVVVYFDLPDSLREVGPLARRARSLWVEPPKAFTGRWVTYYANGTVDKDIQYNNGVYERFTAYYDNGQLTNVQVYVKGEIDGPEIGYHHSGSKAYEIRYSAGKPAGRWVHWFPNGNKESEQAYLDGKLEGPTMNWREDGSKASRIDYKQGQETGQAAWDEHGTLLYAHGTAQNPAP